MIASGIFHPESGGPATYLYEVLPVLQRHGWDVRALAYGAATADNYPYPLTRIPRRKLPLRQLDYARAAWPLLRWADVTYIHSLGLPLIGGNSPRVIKIVGDQAWERSVRLGWIPPTEDIDQFQTKHDDRRVSLAKWWRAREAAQADAVIVPSEYLRQMVIGWGAKPDRVHRIYNALPLSDLPTLISPAEARQKLGLPDAPLLLTAARLMPWKGVDHLIAALYDLPDVHLIVAGAGSMLKPLRIAVEALGMAGRVHFLGQVPRETLALYFRAVDYTALYSGYEGLSHVLLESLRAGTPVIASDKGGNPEVVQPNVNGWLVPYVDADALQTTLKLAFEPGVRDRLAAGTGSGLEHFAFDGMAEQTAAVLAAQLKA